jgi:hypothetical protein
LTGPSLVRQALDALMRAYPMFDLVAIEWPDLDGPWVLVSLGQPSEGDTLAWARWEFAIWQRTGAIHLMQNGAVSDEPVLVPPYR